MSNNKFVIESFVQFLENVEPLKEAEKSVKTIFGSGESKDLIDQMMEYNADLGASNLSENALETSAGSLKKKAAEYLRDKEYWKAAACNVFWRQSDMGMKPDLKLFKQLGLTKEDLTNPKLSERFAKFREALDSVKNEDLRDSIVNVIEEYPNVLSPQTRYSVLWQLVPEADKAKVYNDFEQLARKKGYDSVDGLKKVIEQHYKSQKKEGRSNLINPAIQVFVDKSQLKDEDGKIPVKTVKTAVIPIENEHETFKPNMWGQNGESDYVEGNFQKMIENIGSILERRKIGEIVRIKGITIMTSCDRRRNTGVAEKMSWGQLAFARSASMASLVVSMAEKVGLQPEEIQTINKMIRLDFTGRNGDGSSGPNPDTNPGYYIKDGEQSKWTGVKDPKEVVIIPASEDGGIPSLTSASGAKTETQAPIQASDKEAFNQYRYNNIVFEIEVLEKPDGKEENIPSVEQFKDLVYPVRMVIPSRYKNKGLTISLPSIKIGKVAGSPGKRPSVSCPTFSGKGKTSIGFGIELRPVKIASWQSDITKN